MRIGTDSDTRDREAEKQLDKLTMKWYISNEVAFEGGVWKQKRKEMV